MSRTQLSKRAREHGKQARFARLPRNTGHPTHRPGIHNRQYPWHVILRRLKPHPRPALSCLSQDKGISPRSGINLYKEKIPYIGCWVDK